jgi:cation diffusion facilitator CzcD-associated flavoprotein CzcO
MTSQPITRPGAAQLLMLQTRLRSWEVTATDVTIAIIGTGFAGLGAAIALRRAGHADLVLLERADDVGGAWRDNTYPGCRCDVQSNLYSFSFAPNPDWSETYPSQPELQAYLRGIAQRYGLRPHIRFGHEVTAARWDDQARRWLVTTSQGEFRARYLIAAAGALAEPSRPGIPGLGTFAGTVMHSARWDPAWSAAGQRVAVIGTGSSAIQLVPALVDQVRSLTLFQRTPAYVMPHNNHPVTPRARRLYRRLPVTQSVLRAADYWAREVLVVGFVLAPRILRRAEAGWRRHLEAAVADPRLREQLTPRYRLGCKRVLLSSDFYPALTRPHAALVTDAITEVTAGAVVTADGRRHEVDTIILATGFRVTDNPVHERITGRGGRTLAAAFGQTYLGTVVPGFPSFFQLVGANTGLGHSSMIYMIESQLAFVADAIAATADGVPRDVRPDVAAAWNRRLQRKLPRTVWGSGCSSWYLDADGRNLTLWPGFTFAFRRRTRHFRPRDFVRLRPG